MKDSFQNRQINSLIASVLLAGMCSSVHAGEKRVLSTVKLPDDVIVVEIIPETGVPVFYPFSKNPIKHVVTLKSADFAQNYTSRIRYYPIAKKDNPKWAEFEYGFYCYIDHVILNGNELLVSGRFLNSAPKKNIWKIDCDSISDFDAIQVVRHFKKRLKYNQVVTEKISMNAPVYGGEMKQLTFQFSISREDNKSYLEKH